MMEPGPFQQSFYPDGEHQYLLPDDDGALPAYATTRRTWIMFCVTFGVLHGCAVTSMVYASSLQGKDLSSASLGAFFAAYTTAALFVATDVVRRVGVKVPERALGRSKAPTTPPDMTRGDCQGALRSLVAEHGARGLVGKCR